MPGLNFGKGGTMMGKKGYTVLCLVLSLMVVVLPGKAYSVSALDGFDPDADGRVQCIAVQSDGKILVGGGFTGIGEVTRNRIARLNPDGSMGWTRRNG
jgi:hypothetical protein